MNIANQIILSFVRTFVNIHSANIFEKSEMTLFQLIIPNQYLQMLLRYLSLKALILLFALRRENFQILIFVNKFFTKKSREFLEICRLMKN